MKKITWDQSFSVGIAMLDEQHKRIIRVVNLLLSHREANVHDETISEALTRLTKYAEEHFKAEEKLLAEHGYPDLPAQRESHAAFRRRMVEFCRKTMARQETVPAALLQYVKDKRLVGEPYLERRHAVPVVPRRPRCQMTRASTGAQPPALRAAADAERHADTGSRLAWGAPASPCPGRQMGRSKG